MAEPVAGAETPWWRTAVVLQLYPRSFADADGDGVGDLEGIRRHLDHVVALGADAIWLSPIYRSPMADFGYDVADHTDVDPVFGDLTAFDRLLGAAHAAGLRLLLDWVPNHTSDQHPWFLASRSSRSDPKRDWYVWRDGAEPAGRAAPNNWRATFDLERPAWTWDERTGQWYLHHFLPQQPDLDWSNPEVRAAMHDVLRFWLDRGVDGFRADVVHLIGKDPSLADDPPALAGRSRPGFHHEPATHELLRGIRGVLDEYDDRVVVGEVNLDDPTAVASYQGEGDELHLVFQFGLLGAPWDAAAWRAAIDGALGAHTAGGGWPTWVLANHDQPRTRTRYGSEARARAAATALLGLRGTPFLYQGEELGLEDAVVPPERVVDPGGRDGCRAPIPWTPGDGHGWPSRPWLPFPPDAGRRSAAAQAGDPASPLVLHRRLLAARRASPALQLGDQRWLPATGGTVLAWSRSWADDRRVVAVNLGGSPAAVALDGDWAVEVASDDHRAAGRPFDGRLGADAAVWLRPAGGARPPGSYPSSSSSA